MKTGEDVWGPNSHKMLKHTMLRSPLRQYVIDHVKKPLMKFLIVIAERWPEPTYENVTHPNSRILLELRDKFVELENNNSRIKMFKAVFKILICEYDHDPYYRPRFDWMLEELMDKVFIGYWKPRQNDAPRSCWREEKPYGQHIGRKYTDSIKPYIREEYR